MKVAVFGAGTMGSGIAQVFAAKGHTALMYASSVASAQRHKDKLYASLNKKVAKGKMAQEAADDLMSRVLVEEFEAAADADLVIECVKEEMGTKKALLKELDAICTVAIVTYCKLHFGEPDEYDRLKASYDEQKAQLSMATGYTTWIDQM